MDKLIKNFIVAQTEDLIDIQNNVIKNNSEELKQLSKKGAEISSEGIEITARAIKNGLTDTKINNKIFRKHCKEKIDEDLKFCKNCGREQ